MTRLPISIIALVLGFAIACASDDDDDSDSTNNSTTATSQTGNTSSAETTGEQVCDSGHLCVGDACHCTTPGKEDDPCDNDMACEAQCEVCM